MAKYPKGSQEMRDYMASIRAMKGKSDKPRKNKKGKGLMSDLLGSVKNMAINEGEKLIKEKAGELVNKGVDTIIKKVRGKGLMKDIAKTVFKGAINMVPMPGIARDIGTNVGELLIEKIGGNLNNNMMVSTDMTVMKRKRGGALKVMGKALKM